MNSIWRAAGSRTTPQTLTRAKMNRGPQLTLVSNSPPADSILETRRTRDLVDGFLTELPERQRSALWLSAVEGNSYAEIAEILETSTQSVKSLIHRARATLADRMSRAKAPAEEATA